MRLLNRIILISLCTFQSLGAFPGQGVDFVPAASKSTPSVVHIKTSATTRHQIIHPFQDLFGQDFFLNAPQIQKREGSGSGVIVSTDGLIMTNAHVIQDADEIIVVLRNKKEYKAKVIGKDLDTDLALIKIEASELPKIQFANSDQVQVGEWVLAVGNPFNLESTVTQGIVSAKGRSLHQSFNPQSNGQTNPIESFIQTDAAVNPGNSGGALVNLEGNLIGINTAIASPTGAYAGYAFAVPSNLVLKVLEDLRDFGIVQRAYLGISIANLTDALSKELKLTSPNGVLIAQVMKGGTGDEAGLQPKDVIVKVNGIETNSNPELLEQIGRYRPGDKISVDIMREGRQMTISAILKSKENSTKLIKLDPTATNRLGVQVKTLTAQENAQYRVQGGVKIVSINDGIIKQTTEMKIGFIVLQVGDKQIKNENEFNEAIQNSQRGTMVLEGFYPNRPFTFQYAFKL